MSRMWESQTRVFGGLWLLLCVCVFFFFFSICLLVYLAVPGLSCSAQDLQSFLWNAGSFFICGMRNF